MQLPAQQHLITRTVCCALLWSLGLAACGDTPKPPAPIMVENPAPEGSAQPSLTVGRDGRVWLSWLQSQGDTNVALQVVAREKGQWSAVRTVVQGSDLLVNWADIPRMAEMANGTVVAGWLRGSSVKAGYDLMLTSSTDAGTTWSVSQPAHHDGIAAEHGFVSFFPQGDALGLIWLDGRNYALADSSKHQTQLMYATLDAQGNLAREFAIDDRICDCCQTAATTAANGSAIVAYRDRSEGEVRDIYVKRIVGNVVNAGVPVHKDNWTIKGCPVNGPSIAALGATIALAWFTAPNDTPHVRLAFSQDTGKTFGAPVEIADGRPEGRVSVGLTPNGDALVGWIETRRDTSVLRLRRVSAQGIKGQATDLASLTGGKRASGFARIVVVGDTALIAWADPLSQRVKTAAIPVGAAK